MKKIKAVALSLLFVFIFLPFVSAEVNTVSVISLTPPNPNPGDSVAVEFSYCVGANEESRFMLAVSSYPTFQAGGTTGQDFKVSEGGFDIGGTGGGTASVSGGYDMNDQQGAAHCQTLTWNIHIPNTISEGGTYYVVIGGKTGIKF
ncbi:MAG: hypothetical protein LLG37_06750 [Spirochaetia bacterium]|nr:hypothetical protein [Spirochaetia bacterium]